MKNPKLISKPFAQNGQKNVIPEKYEASMESNQATWDQGFGQITMLPVSAGGLPPKGQDFNGILNQISETLVHISKGGVFKFSADYAVAINGYPKGAILQSEDEKKYYQSLIDNNKVNFNTASQDQIKTSWKLVITNDLLDQLSKKLESSAVVQSTGTSTTSVMSQKASTDSFQPKGNYQPAGNYVTTEAFNSEINKKIDKSNISQQLANDANKVPSLDLVTKELGNKQPRGDYQPAGDYATTKDLEKKFDKSGGHITGDVRVTDGKSLRVNAPNNNGDTFIMTREDLSTWIGNTYADITIREDGLYSSGNKVVTENTLSNGAYRGISDNIVFSGQNKYSQLSMQTYADFRKIISYDIAESYPEGVSGGIATGKQIQKPELDFVCLLNIRGWYDKSGASSCGQIYITPTGNIGFRYNQYNAEDNAHYLTPVDIYCTNNTTVDNDGFIRKLGYTDNSIVFPIPWSQQTPPPGYLVCNGQSFNTVTYPKLTQAYPSGQLPDLRGEFIRGLDSGRGIDAGRSVLSAQKGNSLLSSNIFGGLSSSESNKWHKAINYIGITGTNNDGGYGVFQQIEGANGNETRPRNIAFLYIVRAA
ncbi:tail fiber protein [Proteus mirabilis]|uniref:phage tail protein n=1 Tax=Proteus mirabilis TaxID=584 RepID=UPI002FC9D335